MNMFVLKPLHGLKFNNREVYAVQRLTRLQRQQLQYINRQIKYNSLTGIVLDVAYYTIDPFIMSAKVNLSNGQTEIIPLSDIMLK